MSYSDGLEALRKGDFRAAALLLEQAASAAHFTSDDINHAYTVALYKAGESARLAEAAFQIGQGLAAAKPGLAMDYFQRAIIAGLDPKKIRQVGALHEEWASPARSRSSSGTPILKVAHVVGDLHVGAAPTLYIRTLSDGLRAHGVVSASFSTEWATAWRFKPSGIDVPSEPANIHSDWRAPGSDDFQDRAHAVARAVEEFAPDVALYHSSFFEQVTARTAGLRPAPIQVHVCHDRAIDANLFDACVQRSRPMQTEFSPAGSVFPWIPVGCDVETRLNAEAPISRRSIGIDTAASVSATFGDLDRICSPAYVATLTEILVRFPNHCHYFVGQGNIRAARQALHAEGVLPRVRFLGAMGDVAPLLSAMDFYLAPFPNLDREFIVDAMGAGKPVIVHRKATDLNGESVGDVVGEADLVADNQSSYVEAVSRIIRISALREKMPEAMRKRFAADHSPAAMAKRYIDLFKSL